jgi:hypothetical protein
MDYNPTDQLVGGNGMTLAFYRTPKLHYCIHKSPALALIVSHMIALEDNGGIKFLS